MAELDRLANVAARVTALAVLVEELMVDKLYNSSDDPEIIKRYGEAIVQTAHEKEKVTRQQVPGIDEYSMVISKEISSIVDRAIRDAIQRRRTPFPP